jgi:hypothetical protein
VRERTPGLGYEFQHANKLYFEQGLKLNECLKLALADQVPLINTHLLLALRIHDTPDPDTVFSKEFRSGSRK